MYFAAALIASLVVSASGLVAPHAQGVSRRHAQLVKARSAEPAPIAAPIFAAEPLVARDVTKRSLRKRCVARSNSTSISQAPVSTSTSTLAATSSVAPPPPVNVAPSPSVKPSSSPQPKPSSSAAPAPVSSPAPTHSAAPSSVPPPAPKPTTSAAPPPPPPSSSPAPSPTSAPPPSSGGGSSSDPYTGSHSGDGTFYATGLGACGITNNDSQNIVAISHILFDGAPGYDGVNPNTNPLCNKQLNINYMGQTTTVTITDRCVGCAQFDLDFSPAAFDVLANPSIGRLHNVDWTWA